MQKADFEKNVQDKMLELRFKPSQEVWTRIESGLEKRKRRSPVFFWLLGTAIVLGGTTYFFMPSSPDKNFANHNKQPGQTIAAKQNEKRDAQKRLSPPTTSAFADQIKTSSADPLLVQKQESESGSSVANNSTHLRQPIETRMENGLPISSDRYNSFSTDPLNEDIHLVFDRDVRNSFPLAVRYNDALQHFDKQVADSYNLPLSESTPQSNNPPPLKKTNWRIGISVSAGASDLGQQILFGPTAAGLSYMPQSANSGGSSYSRPSDVRASGAFSIGAYTMKSIGARWKLGTGIYYHYFSNSIKVGDKVDSTVFLNQNNLSMDRVNGYYKSNGSSPYHNKYHFISIPVTLLWQFAKRFNWENQFMYARMINTNALHYDGANRAYYENESLFNKNQFAYSTSVLFGFNKNKIQVGPQLFYAFSDLLKTSGNGDPKHLRSISIKSNIELWKN